MPPLPLRADGRIFALWPDGTWCWESDINEALLSMDENYTLFICIETHEATDAPRSAIAYDASVQSNATH